MQLNDFDLAILKRHRSVGTPRLGYCRVESKHCDYKKT